SPSAANGHVLVGSNDNKLYAYGNAAAVLTVTGSSLANMTTSPGTLSPSFATSTSDYVVPCQGGTNAVTLQMTASSGNITVAGQTGSTVSTSVKLVESQAAVVVAPDPANPSGPATQYWVRCLPHDFPQIQVTKPGSPTPGYYLYGNTTATAGVSGTYNMILNGNGTPVWFSATSAGPLGLQLLPNDTLAWAQGQSSPFFNLQLDSQTTQVVRAPVPPTDGHEYLLEPNGDRMLFATPLLSGVDLTSIGEGTNQTIQDHVVQEIDPQGNLVWSWRASDHIAVGETQPALLSSMTKNGQTVWDVFHFNSIDVDPTGTLVLISGRNLAAVYEVNKATGKVVWKLGGTGTNPDNPQILTIQNDPETTISGQHDARFQPNGDVSLFDDQTGRSGAARGVEYAIDTTAGTATMDFEYVNPDGKGSLATGSFRRSADGTSVIGWGFHTGSGFTEVDGSGTVLFQVTFPNGESGYRSIKVASTAISLNLLRESVGLIGTAPS
ncbi:MAG TPA: aryl-sulfate sulfotransferase, partial [Acidimicrobiales bacterium]|nr:aryl-sulfate sulfotransferase [Acidimicrobiales bacterium]